MNQALQPSPKLILASASPRRVELLEKIGLAPDALMPADLDETPFRREAPHALALRLACAKAETVFVRSKSSGDFNAAYFVAADTVVAVGRRILPQCALYEEAEACLQLLSGRQHRVYTAVCVCAPQNVQKHRLVETRVRFKRLSRAEMEAYLASGEWRGKAGGYAIQGLAGAFVQKLQGSYSAVVGLPVHETVALLEGLGFPTRRGWLEGH